MTVAPASLHPVERRAWHGADAADLLVLLGSSAEAGLSSTEAARRLEVDGPNRLAPASSGGAVRRLLRQLHNPLIYVLLVAAAVSALLGEIVDAAVIFGVVVINAAVGYVQESQAEAALAALRAMVSTTARVLRDGATRTVPSEHLVRGDLVLLEGGDKVAADLRLLRQSELRIDESMLTGESLPVRKSPVALDDDTALADRRNMAYAGTLVTGGTAAGLVVATGSHTELAEIQRLVTTVGPVPTPLTKVLARFSRLLTVVILLLAVLAFVSGTLRGQPAAEMFTAAVALAVGAIPEGLPAAVTITLAIGVTRMARRKAVIRYLPAVETLGSTTVVCTDKTGTLTENRMAVTLVHAGARHFAVEEHEGQRRLTDESGEAVVAREGTALWWCLAAGAACNDLRIGEHGLSDLPGDPTETALVVSAAAGGLDIAAWESTWPRRSSLPFSSERRFMATLHDKPDGSSVVFVKGAAERVLSLCDLMLADDGTTLPVQPEPLLEEVTSLAQHGLRVLATGFVPDGESLEELTQDGLRGHLVLAGLQAMWDPPRESAASAVLTCHAAGIEVKMITGDHPSTAGAIGHALQLGPTDAEPPKVLTGRQLDELGDEEYAAAVSATEVFARVSPGQKLRLVQALQHRGHVVAMTGDGVNDAPALKQADIGVAMGRSGTEVAKEASDMVLLDDDFATVEAAIEEGRGVFDNLTKFLTWTLPTNMAEGLVILSAVLVGATLPVLPTQILWVNMTTAVLLGLTLAFEPAEPGAMTRPPRDPRAPLLPRPLLARMAVVSVVLVAATWISFQWEQAADGSLDEARTAAVNMLVTLQVVYLFACRSTHRSALALGLLSNRWLLAGVAAQATVQLAFTYLGPMQAAFDTAPLDLESWGRLLLLGVVGGLVLAVDKRLRTARARARDMAT